jgi:very-short-patch-repair endonuclease
MENRMPKKHPGNKHLLSVKPVIGAQYSNNNTTPVIDVFPTDTREFEFICQSCELPFTTSPSKLKGAYELVYCSNCEGSKKKKIAYLKMQDKVKRDGSLAEKFPEIAKTWKKVEEELDQYCSRTVTSACTLEVVWQCNDVSYHQWSQRVDRRVQHPKCPFCTGQRVHINDSYYVYLKEQSRLQDLAVTSHEDAKLITKGNSRKKLLHNCTNCSSPYNAAPYTFLKTTGCTKCYSTLYDHLEQLCKEHGAIAGDENLAKQYCFNQKYIPDEYKNELPPEKVPLSYTTSVYWICDKEHITKSPPSIRAKGARCGKCSNNSSFLELLIFTEMKKVFGEQNVKNKYYLDKQRREIDVLLDSESIAIEIDGYAYHDDKESRTRDRKKSKLILSQGYKLVRLRDSRLNSLLDGSEEWNYEYAHVSQAAVEKNVDSREHIAQLVNDIISFCGIDRYIDELTTIEEAKRLWVECNNVRRSESVGELYPELLEEVDPDLHGKDLLFNITPGSNTTVNWVCSKCNYKWLIGINRRTGIDATGCPACAGQAISDKNSVGILYPMINESFVCKNGDSQYTAGSGKRALFKCTFPGCKVKPKYRAIKDVVAQIKNRGNCYFFSCKHV